MSRLDEGVASRVLREVSAPAERFALGVVIAASAAVVVAVLGSWQFLTEGIWLWEPILLAISLIVAERFAVRVPIRSQRVAISLVDAVIVVGVFFLPPPIAIVATAVGVGLSQLMGQRPVIKKAFNTAQYVLAVSAATGVAVLAANGQHGGFPRAQLSLRGAHLGPVHVRWVLATLLGMAAFFVVNNVLVSFVVKLSVRRGFMEVLWRGMPVVTAHWAANAAYGLVAAVLVTDDAKYLPLLIVPVGLTFLGNRAWGRSVAQGERMHWLYNAGRALSSRLGDPDSWRSFLTRAADLLNCEGTAAFLGRPDDNVLEVILSDGRIERLPAPPSASAWELVAKAYGRDGRWRAPLLVPMEAEERVVGYVAAWGPRLDTTLPAADRETLRTLANQAATALLNESLYRAAESERAALRDIVGHSSDGIYTVGGDRTVRSWNPAMAALTGYDEEEAVGQRCFNLLRARDGRGVDMCASDCPILAAAATGDEQIRDASVLAKDGAARWIRYAHAPIRAADGTMEADVVVVRDVTRERHADELKADFVASVSHELRTPLTPIKGFLLTLLRDDRDFDRATSREYYKLMLSQTERLEHLVEDLLEVTRVEAASALIESVPIDLTDLAGQAVARFGSEHPGRDIRLMAPSHPVMVRGDWLRTDQVLGNLLSNALRYSSAGEPVEVRVVASGQEVVVEVRDRGAGIAADEQQRIFERFVRGGHYLTRDQGGAGLGLYLAKRLVEAMGGRIWVSSRLGHGSVFSFALPAQQGLRIVSSSRRAG